MVSGVAIGHTVAVSIAPSEAARPLRIRLLRVGVPLVHEHRAAHGVERHREVILVEWTSAEGIVGWGECPTLETAGYATETTERAWAALTVELGPAAVTGQMPMVAGCIAAAAALSDARLDARLRTAGTPLGVHLGAEHSPLPRCAVIAAIGARPQEVADRARRAVAAGARMVKLKIAPGHDVEPLRAIRAVLDGVPLAADANGSYVDARALGRVDELDLAYLEQPFPATHTWDELATLHAGLRTSVALDESLTSPDAVRSAIAAGALDVVSVKPARLGGIEAAASVVRFTAESDVDVFVGGMLELGIGRAGAAAVAAMPGCSLPTDLGPSADYVATDVCSPIVVDRDGLLLAPSGVGIGRTPDADTLEQFILDEVLISS